MNTFLWGANPLPFWAPRSGPRPLPWLHRCGQEGFWWRAWSVGEEDTDAVLGGGSVPVPSGDRSTPSSPPLTLLSASRLTEGRVTPAEKD